MKTKEKIVEQYWKAFDEYNFDLAGTFMDTNAKVIWPNTQEIFKGRDNFILTQKNYPGTWKIILEKLISINEIVISVVKVTSVENSQSLYATSFFEFKGNYIIKITEYWGEISEPPEWRINGGWSDRY
ncbi:MAG: nuclear transport factor 2 family protein [Candidatus Cloacimonetes bacterium]|nr:nuclear transport factor 2 family protein [Candidatus Cloacimonadota bacterium]MCK4358604.1 nuclear transport factor 2 family protein [Candidatus Cloacimonadota bacterium]